jgi:hypothetical protein
MMDILPKQYWWVWRGFHFAIAKSLSWRKPGEPTTWIGTIESERGIKHFVIGPLLISWKATRP